MLNWEIHDDAKSYPSLLLSFDSKIPGLPEEVRVCSRHGEEVTMCFDN
jgi:hypothetical protein